MGRNTFPQSMHVVRKPRESSENLLTDVGRYEQMQQIRSILFYRIMVSQLSEVSSETSTSLYCILWPTNTETEKSTWEEEHCFTQWMLHISVPQVSVQSRAPKGIQNTELETLQKQWEKDRGVSGEKRRGRGGKSRWSGEWLRPAMGLLRSLREFWEVSKNNLQIILDNIRHYPREQWCSRNRICVMLLPEVANPRKNWLISMNGSLWTHTLPWVWNLRGDNSFFHARLGHYIRHPALF